MKPEAFHQPQPPQAPEMPEAVLAIRRNELKPEVRKYADNLHAQILAIYEKYGVSNYNEFEASVASRISIEELKHLKGLMDKLIEVTEKGELPGIVLPPELEAIKEKIQMISLEIGGQTEQELEEALERVGFRISDNARHMMRSPDFTTESKKEQTNLICLSVDALFNDGKVHTTDEIYAKAQEFGLELCPAEVGPYLRLSYKDQPLNEWLRIAMKQIAGSGGRPGVFSVGHGGGGLWLNGSWARPDSEWNPDYEFVFRLRK